MKILIFRENDTYTYMHTEFLGMVPIVHNVHKCPRVKGEGKQVQYDSNGCYFFMMRLVWLSCLFLKDNERRVGRLHILPTLFYLRSSK